MIFRWNYWRKIWFESWIGFESWGFDDILQNLKINKSQNSDNQHFIPLGPSQAFLPKFAKHPISDENYPKPDPKTPF